MAALDQRSHRVVKKGRERKLSRALDKELISQAIEIDQGSPTDNDNKRNDKKSQGIIIDGKTYTCATCKAGHRVGVCKHGKERPMKATHPPGRPPAGAPKKVVCDCPKTCTCAKKDCKCARRCNCTQAMYMLVYIPAPDEDENDEDEKGSWKLGQQVTTDLKGNILTPEQVRERREKKDALKTLQPGLLASNESAVDSPGPSDVSQAGPKSCCKHKENVSNRNIAAQATSMTEMAPKASADGCNCGHACNCAFCPQHPNNSTSLNVARLQAMHFANHPSMDNHSIVPFLPTVPQDISCMGGQPRFAMSRHSGRPSFKDLQSIFPNPGYVIGYPVWPLGNDPNQYTIPPFQSANEHLFVDGASLQYPNVPMTPSHAAQTFALPPKEYGIGDAFVASAGVDGWNNDAFNSANWHFDDTPGMTTPFSQAEATTPFHVMSPDLDSVMSPAVPFDPRSDSHTGGYLQPSDVTEPLDAFQTSSCCNPNDKSTTPFETDHFIHMPNDSKSQYGGLA